MTTPKENKIQRKIWIRKLHINIAFEDFPSAMYDIEKRISRMATNCGLDLHDMALELIMNGLIEKEQAYEELCKQANVDGLDEQHKRLIALFNEQERIATKNKLLNDLMPIFKDRGTEGFEEWCKDNDYDAHEFYRLHEQSLEKLSWSKRAKAWIEFELEKANDPIPVEEIRNMARNFGILDRNETNWNAFEKIAQRLGVTNKPYGHWFKE